MNNNKIWRKEMRRQSNVDGTEEQKTEFLYSREWKMARIIRVLYDNLCSHFADHIDTYKRYMRCVIVMNVPHVSAHSATASPGVDAPSTLLWIEVGIHFSLDAWCVLLRKKNYRKTAERNEFEVAGNRVKSVCIRYKHSVFIGIVYLYFGLFSSDCGSSKQT